MDECILYYVLKVATGVYKNVCDMQMTDILLVCAAICLCKRFATGHLKL
jgi:hypothetical protein